MCAEEDQVLMAVVVCMIIKSGQLMDAFGAGAGDRGSATCIPPPPPPPPPSFFFISYTRYSNGADVHH